MGAGGGPVGLRQVDHPAVGGHFREDYPQKADEYSTFNIMVKRGSDGRVQVSRVPIPAMPDYLKDVIEEQKS